MKQGTIVLASFPYSDQSDSKVRPLLIVSNSKSQPDEDFVLCEITSRSRKKDEVEISSKDISGKLPFTSYIRPLKIATLHKRTFIRTIGQLSTVKMEEVARILIQNFEIEV